MCYFPVWLSSQYIHPVNAHLLQQFFHAWMHLWNASLSMVPGPTVALHWMMPSSVARQWTWSPIFRVGKSQKSQDVRSAAYSSYGMSAVCLFTKNWCIAYPCTWGIVVMQDPSCLIPFHLSFFCQNCLCWCMWDNHIIHNIIDGYAMGWRIPASSPLKLFQHSQKLKVFHGKAPLLAVLAHFLSGSTSHTWLFFLRASSP